MNERQTVPTAEHGDVQEEVGQYLTFYLQEEMFGLNIRPIKEISEYGRVTPVPMVPPYERGVINLRGKVVPVIDLAVRFGWPAAPINKRSCIVMVEIEGEQGPLEAGIVIDRVSEVLEIPAGEIGTAPRLGTRVRTDFIQGMAQIGDAFTVLLDVQRVLCADELAQLGSMAQSA